MIRICNSPLVTQFTLNHHAGFGFATETKNVRESVCVSIMLFHMLRGVFPRGRFDRHARLVTELEARIVTLLDDEHVLVENMKRGTGI